MRVHRLIAIGIIYAGVAAAWFVLGSTVQVRTNDLDKSLSAEMNNLWGPKVLVQTAPQWVGAKKDAPAAAPAKSTVRAAITHDQRYKGLLWYSTFAVDFSADYTLAKAESDPVGNFVFRLPAAVTAYDNLAVTLDGQAVDIPAASVASRELNIALDRKAEHVVTVRYKTSGQDIWLYAPGSVSNLAEGDGCESSTIPEDASGRRYRISSAGSQMTAMNDFELTIATNFEDIDYPTGTRSPSSPATREKGTSTATWKYANALTNQAMGVVMPARTNAGPITSRLSFFAPVSLFFFFVTLFAVVVLRKLPLHPMHYLFIAAGFFAFHILLAYLADVISIHAAFWVCAVVSTFLVITYMRLVAGIKFAVLYVGAAQVVYLVGFSYAFFLVGRTGLIIAIGSIATLFVLMQATGRVNWHAVFNPSGGEPEPPPTAQAWAPVYSPAGPAGPVGTPPTAPPRSPRLP
ncbi:MAG: inner membrane CreD family protein [Phycisphaerae bacterium]|nr:inner membrane CreD family protein [Phycisphaerae bacterium]